MTWEEMLVTLLLARLSTADRRILKIAVTKEIATREQLIKEVLPMTYGKRPGRDSQDEPPAKRSKGDCYYCKKPGHHMADCRKRQPASNNITPRNQAGPSKFPPSKAVSTSSKSRRGVCYICQSTEHYANECPKRSGNGSKRKVEMCTVNPVGTLTHNGEQFCFTFDSGAECSLLRDSIRNKFSGPIFETPVFLSGIGQGKVTSHTQVVSEVIIDGNILNICFHVVPDQNLSSDIMIGREVLSMGIQVTLTPKSCLFVPTDLKLSSSMSRKIFGMQDKVDNQIMSESQIEES
jgi:Zinc knuckle.